MSKCADCNELVGEEWSANNGLCSTCARDELSKPDTNQASEDELRESIDALLERWRNILTYKGDGNGDEYYQSEVIDDIQEIIRAEKLKLLAEVRERVVGEDKKPTGSMTGLITIDTARNELRAEMRDKLSKLEAEL